ncbi:hypothetical protein [Deinococcus soli (ex Cha et al. 2016)]|uniref:Uncharacterized protein n=2 Tax=Deinococcus soli (ex Cha et al. 2016) TaxID=1309411 RepID=A0ACC6KFE1_9DEIO|nr:hypothetical protein [Deinococcus soli (ex Cha et al. 2016)]MDR6218230.1 hypothetical protein [Deinococcus soli (ex Cha et al. 2016)]MDR6328970.1 hypothetical protein [Deinococcus soli (ex Cha et al. 2016)]MDR6751243.1 hypothetical protein [Deinococcus soli (ex Cha et al. 2016)]
MKQLQAAVKEWTAQLPPALQGELRGLLARAGDPPLGQLVHTLVYLATHGVLSWAQFEQELTRYEQRNPNLLLFELSARAFGDHCEALVRQHAPRLLRPTRALDAQYAGEYDLLLPDAPAGVRVEVKGSRAVAARARGSMSGRALHSGAAAPFVMNFQHLKMHCADVFILVPVWSDVVQYWVLNGAEVKRLPGYCGSQTRDNQLEAQLHVKPSTAALMTPFETPPAQLPEAVKVAFARQAAPQGSTVAGRVGAD